MRETDIARGRQLWLNLQLAHAFAFPPPGYEDWQVYLRATAKACYPEGKGTINPGMLPAYENALGSLDDWWKSASAALPSRELARLPAEILRFFVAPALRAEAIGGKVRNSGTKLPALAVLITPYVRLPKRHWKALRQTLKDAGLTDAAIPGLLLDAVATAAKDAKNLKQVRIGKEWIAGRWPIVPADSLSLSQLSKHLLARALEAIRPRDADKERDASRTRATARRRKRGVMPRRGKAPKQHLPDELPADWRNSIGRAAEWWKSEGTSAATPADRARAAACDYLAQIPSGRSRPDHDNGIAAIAAKWSVSTRTLQRALAGLRGIMRIDQL